MPATVPTTEPTELVAGDTLVFDRAFAGYSAADGDVLAYHLGGLSALEWDPSWATPNGAGWSIAVPAASTAGLKAGAYRWFARITQGATVRTVASGTLLVHANPETAGTAYRFWEEEALEMVRARLRGDISHGVMNYMLYGRSVSRYSLEALTKYERQLEQRLQQRIRGDAGPRVESIPFAFRRPA